MIKSLKTILLLFWLAVSLLLAWAYWTGMAPERMKSSVSSAGMEVQLRITGTPSWRPEFSTAAVVSFLTLFGIPAKLDLQSIL